MRIAEEERNLIVRAARLLKIKPTQYVRDAALTRAQMDLMDQRTFTLDEERWKELDEILAAPAQPLPQLAKRLREKPVWEK
jgi:uncharacterized protein (DUF1778 family)